MANLSLKWTKDDPSTSIMLTFDAKWLEPLLDGKVLYAFRKMGPRQFVPEEIYGYFSQPVSAVALKCSVTSWKSLGIEDALALTGKANISELELRSYAKNYSELLVIGLSNFRKAGKRIAMQDLRKEYGFWPSSTFMPLSQTGCRTLDKLGEFTPVV